MVNYTVGLDIEFPQQYFFKTIIVCTSVMVFCALLDFRYLFLLGWKYLYGKFIKVLFILGRENWRNENASVVSQAVHHLEVKSPLTTKFDDDPTDMSEMITFDTEQQDNGITLQSEHLILGKTLLQIYNIWFLLVKLKLCHKFINRFCFRYFILLYKVINPFAIFGFLNGCS